MAAVPKHDRILRRMCESVKACVNRHAISCTRLNPEPISPCEAPPNLRMQPTRCASLRGLAGAAYYKKGRCPGALGVDHPRDRDMEGVGVSDEDAARMGRGWRGLIALAPTGLEQLWRGPIRKDDICGPSGCAARCLSQLRFDKGKCGNVPRSYRKIERHSLGKIDERSENRPVSCRSDGNWIHGGDLGIHVPLGDAEATEASCHEFRQSIRKMPSVACRD